MGEKRHRFANGWYGWHGFLLSFRFLPRKKRVGREQDVDQFLTALRSACFKNDGTKTGQKSDLSNQRAVCPDAPLKSRLHPSITKLTISSVTSKRADTIPPFPGSDAFRPAGSEYHENTRDRVLWYPRRKKLKLFFTFFLMALSSPTLPSFLSCIVQDRTSPSAACSAAFVMPVLYNRHLCHVLNLTWLSVSTGAPNAMFPELPLYIRLAVRLQLDLPCPLRKSVGKSGLWATPNTLCANIIRLFI